MRADDGFQKPINRLVEQVVHVIEIALVIGVGNFYGRVGVVQEFKNRARFHSRPRALRQCSHGVQVVQIHGENVVPNPPR